MSIQLEREDAEDYARRNRLTPFEKFVRLICSVFLTWLLYKIFLILFFHDFWVKDSKGIFPKPPTYTSDLVVLTYWIGVCGCLFSCGILFLICLTSNSIREMLSNLFSVRVLVLILALTAIAVGIIYYSKYLA